MARWLPAALVALCFLLGVASRGLNDSFGAFVLPLEAAFGAPRADVTAIYSVSMAAIGFGGPLTGWMVDRLGLRATVTFGLVCAGAGAALASQATALWQLHLTLGLLLGAACASVGGVLQAAMLGRWFTARLGTALAIAYSANGIGMTIVAPAAQALVEWRDWRFAYLAIGSAVLCLAPALLLLPWKRIEAGRPGSGSAPLPASGDPGSGPSLGDALRQPAFWRLSVSFGLTSVGIYSLAPQVVAYLVERGLGPVEAAAAWGLAGLAMPLGMVGFNWLADRGGRSLAAAAAYVCTLAGIAALAAVRGPGDTAFLAVFVVLFGGTMGSRGPMISTLAALRYRGPHLGRIYGAITCAMGLGGGLGAWAGGVAHDLSGGYGAVMALSAAALAAGALPLIGEARRRERAG